VGGGLLYSHKKKEVLTHVSVWVNLEDVMCCEGNHTQISLAWELMAVTLTGTKSRVWVPGAGRG
jgi:hypothetical protein